MLSYRDTFLEQNFCRSYCKSQNQIPNLFIVLSWIQRSISNSFVIQKQWRQADKLWKKAGSRWQDLGILFSRLSYDMLWISVSRLVVSIFSLLLTHRRFGLANPEPVNLYSQWSDGRIEIDLNRFSPYASALITHETHQSVNFRHFYLDWIRSRLRGLGDRAFHRDSVVWLQTTNYIRELRLELALRSASRLITAFRINRFPDDVQLNQSISRLFMTLFVGNKRETTMTHINVSLNPPIEDWSVVNLTRMWHRELAIPIRH
jgi:hypothetical protein